ncbi:MAG TPA: hypothetical protein VFB20_07310, partial [Burkholderiales bacterium]|nr:hypothetical protein [Burkholderiales bacterium]
MDYWTLYAQYRLYARFRPAKDVLHCENPGTDSNRDRREDLTEQDFRIFDCSMAEDLELSEPLLQITGHR